MNQNQAFPLRRGRAVRYPSAWAVLRGSNAFPQLRGTVRFYENGNGVLVVTEVMGLPTAQPPCESNIFALHIHEGGSCTGSEQDPFADVGMHYNPLGCPHPHHAGDMPPLFGVNGYAFGAFVTDRFTVREIVGRSVILHGSTDDFTTQPAGGAGQKIACGEIMGRKR
jgi:Cu-Zn family superoxide dismutase